MNAMVESGVQEVRRRTERGVELVLQVPGAIVYFEGHFPGYAILPGIVQIDWAIHLARRFLGLGEAPVRSMQVKFRKPIRPDTMLVVDLSLTADGRRLAVEYRDADEICATARIGF